MKWRHIIKPMFNITENVVEEPVVNLPSILTLSISREMRPPSQSISAMAAAKRTQLKRTLSESSSSSSTLPKKSTTIKRTQSTRGQSSTKKSGAGLDNILMQVSSNPVDYVYWDDPNDLVERLRVLIAETQAGHTGHHNEIYFIIEELREASIVE